MTTETNAERLEIIRDKQMQMHALSTFDVNWLIQQAERVQELERHMSMSGRNSLLFSLADCDAENKRLRKALKLVGSDICTEEDREFIVERALKGESV